MKKHNCKQFKKYLEIWGRDTLISEIIKFENDWCLDLSNGLLINIFYCSFCGKKLT